MRPVGRSLPSLNALSRLVWLLFLQQVALSHSVSRDALDQFDEFDVEENNPVPRYDMDHARECRWRRRKKYGQIAVSVIFDHIGRSLHAFGKQ